MVELPMNEEAPPKVRCNHLYKTDVSINVGTSMTTPGIHFCHPDYLQKIHLLK